jgi:hypothetical protein
MSALSKRVYPVSYAVMMARCPAARLSGVTFDESHEPATRQHPYAKRLLRRELTPSNIVCIVFLKEPRLDTHYPSAMGN